MEEGVVGPSILSPLFEMFNEVIIKERFLLIDSLFFFVIIFSLSFHLQFKVEKKNRNKFYDNRVQKLAKVVETNVTIS